MNLRQIVPVLLLAMACTAHAQGSPRVTIQSGTLQGAGDGTVSSFKAIPYAAPPLGALRWRAPGPVTAWRGVRAADKFGPICQQKYNATDNGVGPLPMSEDCLTLNVFAPVGIKKAPVMFWIHGGGFVNGSGTAALYDGTELARQGVVVVTINYRLGRFGFFAHPALSAEAKGEPVGNYAVMDMIAALEWVRANIAKFGGDPRNVTIFGESAGGAAVNSLMASPRATGLFTRAISQSGLGREPVLALADAEKAGSAFAKAVGAVETTSGLRALTAEAILKAGDPDMISGGGVIVDGDVVQSSPLGGFKAGRQARIPYLVGWNSLEFPVPAAMVTARLRADSPLKPDALQRVKAAYPDPASYDANLLSDVLFVEPALALARLHAARGLPTFVYQFSILPKSASTALKGAPHALERQYVFKTLGSSPFPTDGTDAAQANLMSSYWVAFAKTGDPNGATVANWPAFVAPSGPILDFTSTGPQVAQLPRKAALEALAAVYPH